MRYGLYHIWCDLHRAFLRSSAKWNLEANQIDQDITWTVKLVNKTALDALNRWSLHLGGLCSQVPLYLTVKKRKHSWWADFVHELVFEGASFAECTVSHAHVFLLLCFRCYFTPPCGLFKVYPTLNPYFPPKMQMKYRSMVISPTYYPQILRWFIVPHPSFAFAPSIVIHQYMVKLLIMKWLFK